MNKTSTPPPGLTDDGFLGHRLKVLQPEKGYRAGIDAVMLAASVPAVAGDRVLDLGAGVGVASLCLAARCDGMNVTGLEVQPDLVATATENAARNGLAAHVSFVEGSLDEKAAALEAKQVPYGGFDHVMTNPPYYEDGKVWTPPDPGKAAAHALGEVDLETWLRVTCSMARPRGTVTIVHRMDALPALLAGVGRWLGALVAFPLWPAEGETAGRVLLQGIKGSRAPFRLSPGLVLHEKGGGFTAAASAVLRDGAPLPLTSA